jgi:hypothetical protein
MYYSCSIIFKRSIISTSVKIAMVIESSAILLWESNWRFPRNKKIWSMHPAQQQSPLFGWHHARLIPSLKVFFGQLWCSAINEFSGHSNMSRRVLTVTPLWWVYKSRVSAITSIIDLISRRITHLAFCKINCTSKPSNLISDYMYCSSHKDFRWMVPRHYEESNSYQTLSCFYMLHYYCSIYVESLKKLRVDR